MATLSPVPAALMDLPPLPPPPQVHVVFDDDAPPELVWYGRCFPGKNVIELNLPRLLQAAQNLGVDVAALIMAAGLHERLHLLYPHECETAVDQRTVGTLNRLNQPQAAMAFKALRQGSRPGAWPRCQNTAVSPAPG